MTWGPWIDGGSYTGRIFPDRTVEVTGFNYSETQTYDPGADPWPVPQMYNDTRNGVFTHSITRAVVNFRQLANCCVAWQLMRGGIPTSDTRVVQGTRKQVIEPYRALSQFAYFTDDETTQWESTTATFGGWLSLGGGPFTADTFGETGYNWGMAPGTARVAKLDWATQLPLAAADAPATWLTDGSGTTLGAAEVADNTTFDFPDDGLFASVAGPDPNLLMFSEYLLPPLAADWPVPPVAGRDNDHQWFVVTSPAGYISQYGVYPTAHIIFPRKRLWHDTQLRTVGGHFATPGGAAVQMEQADSTWLPIENP